MEESIERGTSVIDWTSSTVWARIPGSSASGMPALTSSICAPASTWASASATTVSKFPAAISAANVFRPVGLMRSPITTNGRSKPITTSRVGDDSSVSVTARPLRSVQRLLPSPAERPLQGFSRAASRLRGSPLCGRCCSPGLLSVVAHELLEHVVGVGRLEPFDLLLDLELEDVAAGARLAAPFLEVRVGADQPGAHRGGVDRLLEARCKLAGGARAPLLRRHLRRDVPPPDDRQLRHGSAPRRSARG